MASNGKIITRSENINYQCHGTAQSVAVWIHGVNSWKLEHSDFLTLLHNDNIVVLTEIWKRNDNTTLLYNNNDLV